MESKQEVKEQAKQQSINWWAVLTNAFISFFKSSPEEKAKAKVIKSGNLVNASKAAVEAKEIVTNARHQAKIEKRIKKAKKAIGVEKLRKNKLIYIQYPGEDTKRKEVFLSFTNDKIITNHGEHDYVNVFSWHGRPVLGPEVVTNV